MEELTVTGLTARNAENVPRFDDVWQRHAATLRVLNLEYRGHDSVPARLNVLRPLLRSHVRLDTLRCADVGRGTPSGCRARDAALLIRELAHAPAAAAERLQHLDLGWLQTDVRSEPGDWEDVWTQFCRAVQHVQLLCLGIRIGGRHAHFAKDVVDDDGGSLLVRLPNRAGEPGFRGFSAEACPQSRPPIHGVLRLDVVIGSNEFRLSSEGGIRILRHQFRTESPLTDGGVSGRSCFPGHRGRC